MPALSPTMTQGNLGPWRKSVGDEVQPGDVLVEIETDKAMMEFEAQEEGFVAKIMLNEGEKNVQVGTPIAVLAEEKDSVAQFDDFVPSENTDAGVSATSETPAPSPQGSASQPTRSDSASASRILSGETDRVFASPVARLEAAKRGMDLSKVTPTGKTEFTRRDRVVLADVQGATTHAQAKSATVSTLIPSESPASEYDDIEITSMRRIIAARLAEVKRTAPDYSVTMRIRMDSINSLRQELNDYASRSSQSNYKLSMNDFVIKASALSLMDVPELNSSWIDDRGDGQPVIRQYKNADISVAVATPTGLITPIITKANIKGLAAISGDMRELSLRARENKLKPNEYQGGTFTISNMGMYGVEQFTAIINQPQSCILAVGAAFNTVSLHNSKLVEGTEMKVTICCDHRVVDGAVAARWLGRFKTYMEKPNLMLL